ncbi:U3-containing 90S pre-ribosomal complex subunit-domain containing protein [Lineolata rhizophorae]|uniref:U3-containing 90S pre-ribosomal complex subunit-domain containing protein n=1 Tax=Lineolata rhizophorae TaxID=578093 RepID=A0A6A6P8G2_9PEZI|nr:U3-containing 90S pre-ribosomal complex subunit-domain containing protein [Lineolata rhizophorae]
MSPSPRPEGKKRKAPHDESKKTKHAKRRKAKKPADINEDELDEKLGVNKAIAKMNSSLLADHIAQRLRRFDPNISLVELEDKYLPGRAIRDTVNWKKDRTMENLPTFLEHEAAEDLRTDPKVPGCPTTLVITSAGIRAADLTRALRTFQMNGCTVAKLFAKHIKLQEAIESCKKLKMNIGVGTPQRVHDLLEDGALSSKGLRRIVIDASYIDQKKRGIFDMKELFIPLFNLLSRPAFRKRYGDSSDLLELIFY